LLAEEMEHRLLNGLQMIATILSIQSRTALPEAAGQMIAAAGRVAALGRVHRTLSLLDDQNHVEFGQYLQHLCENLRCLFFSHAGDQLVVETERAEIPTDIATALGLIINELITNSAKYARSNVTVRFKLKSPRRCSLSVSDDGPGLPTAFDIASSKGLGMNIVQSLVKQIAGELQIVPGNCGCGIRFTITFGRNDEARRPVRLSK
jgi:two-component sensor histidine kinase